MTIISVDAEPLCECRMMVLNILIFPPTIGLSQDVNAFLNWVRITKYDLTMHDTGMSLWILP